MNARTSIRLRKRQRSFAGFTLTEILVAVVLLSLSLAAMVMLWSLSRRVTENSRSAAEYYAVARQDMERGRRLGFTGLFDADGVPTGAYSTFTDYDERGMFQNAAASFDAEPATNTMYRVQSTYDLASVEKVRPGETPNVLQSVGVQTIRVYKINSARGEAAPAAPQAGARGFGREPVYQTAACFAITGI